MPYKFFITTLLILLGLDSSSAQIEVDRQLITTFGSSSEDVEMSLGEVVINGLSNSNFVLSQGFHQLAFTNTTSTQESTPSELTFKAYPNPFVDKIFLELTDNSSIAQLKILSMDGRLIDRRSISPGTGVVTVNNLSRLMPSNYLLIAYTQKREVASYAIINKSN